MSCKWVVPLLFLLSGCANLGTISRTTPLEEKSGVAIHLDSPQRLVYQNSRGYLCAEPTPDALQSYANAAGGSATNGGRNAVSLSNAFTANAFGLGLHTQSITLMRDILYRICEQSHNRRLSDIDVMQLLQRAQDLTLGVLAIEQLTGAVTARQPLIVNTASANAANAINDTQAQLDIAKRSEDAKKAALDALKLEEDNVKASLATAETALATEASKPAEEQDAAKIKTLNDQLASLKTELAAKTTSRQSAEVAHKNAIAATKAIEAMVAAYVNNSNATVGGTATFGDPVSRGTADNATIQKVADTTLEIVKAVVNKGHLTDSCMTFYSSLMSNGKENFSNADIERITKMCQAVIEANIANNKEYTARVTPGVAPVNLTKNDPPPVVAQDGSDAVTLSQGVRQSDAAKEKPATKKGK